MGIQITQDYQGNVNGTVFVVDTIEDLVSLSGNVPNYVYVSGYHTKGDGAFGGHIFEWDPTSTEPHNGGTIIELGAPFPTDWNDQTQLDNWFNYDGGTTGRYKLKYDGDFIKPEWFGAKGDGTTDDTLPIKYAITTTADYNYVGVNSYQGVSVILLTGVYYINGDLGAIGNRKVIRGIDKDKSVLKFNATTTNKYLLRLDSLCRVENLTLENVGANIDDSVAIASYTPSVDNGMSNSQIRNVQIKNFGYGIGYDDVGNPSNGPTPRSMMWNCIFENVQFYNCKVAVALYVESTTCSFINCGFWDSRQRHIRINNSSTIDFIGCQFEYLQNGALDGGWINDSSAINFINCYFEPLSSFVFDNVAGVNFSNCKANYITGRILFRYGTYGKVDMFYNQESVSSTLSAGSLVSVDSQSYCDFNEKLYKDNSGNYIIGRKYNEDIIDVPATNFVLTSVKKLKAVSFSLNVFSLSAGSSILIPSQEGLLVLEVFVDGVGKSTCIFAVAKSSSNWLVSKLVGGLSSYFTLEGRTDGVYFKNNSSSSRNYTFRGFYLALK